MSVHQLSFMFSNKLHHKMTFLLQPSQPPPIASQFNECLGYFGGDPCIVSSRSAMSHTVVLSISIDSNKNNLSDPNIHVIKWYEYLTHNLQKTKGFNIKMFLNKTSTPSFLTKSNLTSHGYPSPTMDFPPCHPKKSGSAFLDHGL